MRTCHSPVSRFHKAWLIGVSYALIAMLGVYITIYQLNILSIAQYFRLSTVAMGFLIGIQHFGMVVPPLILGVLCAKIGKRKVIVIALALMIAGTTLAAATRQLWMFVLAVFFIGAGFSVSEATLSALLTDEYPEESKRHLGFSQAAFSIGALIGPFLAQRLIRSGVYFKDLFYDCAIVFFVLFSAFFFIRLQNDKGTMPSRPSREYYRDFFGNKTLVLIGIVIFLYVGIENTVANFADSYFELVIGRPEFSALALAFFWGAMIPSRILFGIWKVDARKSFLALSCLLALSLTAAMTIRNPSMKIMLFACSGFFCGPMWPMLMDGAANKTAGSAGPALNIMMSFSALGGAALPFAAGIAAEGQSVSAAYLLCALATVVMLGIYLLSGRRPRIRTLK